MYFVYSELMNMSWAFSWKVQEKSFSGLVWNGGIFKKLGVLTKKDVFVLIGYMFRKMMLYGVKISLYIIMIWWWIHLGVVAL